MEKTKTRIDMFLYPDGILVDRDCDPKDIIHLLEKRGLLKKHPNDPNHGCTVEDSDPEEVVYIWY